MLRKELTRGAIRGIVVVLALALGSLAQDGANGAVVAKAQPASGKAASGQAAEDTRDASKSASRPAAAPVDDAHAYRIGVEDELGISVWHEPDLSTNAVVRPDGMITLPLLNDVKVAGLTTQELQNTLTDRLKDFVKEPQVTVVVRQIRSRKVYLMGEVVRPGTYPLNDHKTVLQLLAEAGGPGPFAKVGSIYVIRENNGARKTLPFHYKRAMSGKNVADDIELQPGDMVVVP